MIPIPFKALPTYLEPLASQVLSLGLLFPVSAIMRQAILKHHHFCSVDL